MSTAPTGSAEAESITAELRAQAEAGYPDTIMLEAGQELTGEVVEYTSAYTTRNELAHIMVLKSLATGKLGSLWLLHTTLRGEIMKLKPRPGEIVYFKYNGIVEPKTPGGSSYHSWDVVVRRDKNNPGTMPWETPGASLDPRNDAVSAFVDEGVPTPVTPTEAATPQPTADDIPF